MRSVSSRGASRATRTVGRGRRGGQRGRRRPGSFRPAGEARWLRVAQSACGGDGVELGVGVNASIAFDARALRLTGTGCATVDQTPR
jgi:hypothetical protein